MFTMDDWLGLVILMVCIASVVALIAMFVVGCVGVVRWWLSERVGATPTTLREGAELAMLKTDPSVIETRRFTEAQVCAAFGVEPRTREEQVITIQNYASVKLPALLRDHNPSKPLSADEVRAMLPTVGDMSIGYYRGDPYGGPPIVIGIDMGAGDDLTTDPLDSIIRDLHSAITDEHLEIRARNRFCEILNRLEDYRAQTRS